MFWNDDFYGTFAQMIGSWRVRGVTLDAIFSWDRLAVSRSSGQCVQVPLIAGASKLCSPLSSQPRPLTRGPAYSSLCRSLYATLEVSQAPILHLSG